MSPALRPRLSGTSLKLDLLPLLSRIIAPEFRAINLHLYTQKERDALDKLVGVMADYGLTYVQERTPEGGYVYNIGKGRVVPVEGGFSGRCFRSQHR